MAKQHLLLVDGDAKSLRVMEVSLKKAGFSVTTAIHGRDALEKVQISAPDLVLADTKMPEMDGFELCKGLKADDRFKSIPFVFLTNQKSVEFKVKGLELGAEDYLTKPIYIKEIVTRVSMILQKAEKERVDRRENKSGFGGNLADMGLVDLVQTFEMGRKTGVLNLQCGRLSGTLHFREGRVVDAELGRHTGENAFYRMLNLSEGTFDLQFVPVERPERIEMSTQGLLMEGMRRLDELGRMLEQIPPLETVFELDYEQLAERLSEIPDEVNGLLRLFDGVRSLQQIVDDSDFEELAALGIISKLYFEGLIREASPAQATPEATPVKAWLQEPPPSVMEPVREELANAEPELPRIDLPVPTLPVSSPQPAPMEVAPLREALKPAPMLALPAAPLVPPPAVPPAIVTVPPAMTPAASAPRAAEVVVFSPREPRPGPYAELAEQWSGTASVPSASGRLLDEAKQRLLTEWGRVDGDVSESPSLWGGAHSWSPAVFSTSTGSGSEAGGVGARPVAEATPPPSSRGPIFGGAATEPPLPPPAPAPELPAEERTPAVRTESRAEAALASLPSISDVPPPSTVRITREEPLTRRLMAVRRRRRAAALWGGLAGAFLVGTAGFVVAQQGRPSVPPEAIAEADPAPPETGEAKPPTETGPVGEAAKEPPTPEMQKAMKLHREVKQAALGLPLSEAPKETAREVATVKEAPKAVPPAPAPAPVPAPIAAPKPPPRESTVAVREDPAPPRAPEVTPPPGGEPVAARNTGAERPSDPDAQFSKLLGQAKRANGAENFRVASLQYRRALALRPESLEAKAGLGIALVNSASSESGYREAVKLLEEAVKGEGKDPRAWLALGMAYQFTAQKPKARDAYQRYLSLEPSGTASGEVRALLKELSE